MIQLKSFYKYCEASIKQGSVKGPWESRPPVNRKEPIYCSFGDSPTPLRQVEVEWQRIQCTSYTKWEAGA